MASSILSPTSAVLPNTAATLGLAATVVGIDVMFRPRAALGQLQFPAPKDPEAQRLVDNLMRSYGVRDSVVGLSILIAWYFGHRETLGWIMVSGIGLMTGVDGCVSRLHIGKGEWNHWPFALVSLGLGGGILGWFGGQ